MVEPDRRFEVMTEATPTRCEICHQADKFDPYTESCLRCQALIVAGSLSQIEAERYQERMQTIAPRADTRIPTSDLFRVAKEAFSLYKRNFLLFISILAVVEIPIGLIGLLPKPEPDNLIDVFQTLGFALIGLVVPSISSGALMKTILDGYRGENASVGSSYRFIIDKGWRYLLTSFLGGIYQFIGYIVCFFGLFYTFPRGFFVSEVSVIEDKYFGEAIRRSKRLGTRNTTMINLFGFLFGLGNLLVLGIFMGPVIIINNAAGLGEFSSDALLQLASIAAGLLAAPIFFTTSVLLYFHIRMRTDDEFKFRYIPAS